jgi:hypothetical protein
MKKLTFSRRIWFKLRTKNQKKRAYKKNELLKSIRAEFAARVTKFQDLRAGLPSVEWEFVESSGEFKRFPRVKKFYAPKQLCFTNNYLETISYIYEIRWQLFGPPAKFNSRDRQRQFSLDIPLRKKRESAGKVPRIFSLAKTVDFRLDAALVLIAEYDRYRRYIDFRPYIDDSDWSDYVRNAFSALGFYDLVEAYGHSAEDPLTEADGKSADIKWVKFVYGDKTGIGTEGSFIDALVAVAGGRNDSRAIYDSLSEAITNSVLHAYPPDSEKELVPASRGWWTAGAYVESKKELHMVAYDQGVGIPATLPKQDKYKDIIKAILTMSDGREYTDADVIQGSIELGRTSTGLAKHGNGMQQIVELVDNLPGSRVLIRSGSGEVTYRGGKSIEKANLAYPFSGTLIWWTLKLPQSDGKSLA